MGNTTFEINGNTKLKRASKLPPYDMQILEAWYRHVTQQQKNNRQQQPNLVVVLQDLESFEANMLRDFITICR